MKIILYKLYIIFLNEINAVLPLLAVNNIKRNVKIHAKNICCICTDISCYRVVR